MTEKEIIIKGINKWIALNEQDDYLDLRNKLDSIKEDFEDQLMIMVSGEFNAGKSTFINAMLGEELLTVDITPATAVITKLTFGDRKRVIAHYTNGNREEFDWSYIENLTAEREGEGEYIRQQLSYVEYQLPSEFLKKFTLIDSPGLTALHSHHTAVTESFMERNEVGIWLFNAMSVGTASELEWLKKMHALKIPTYGVVNAIDRLDEEEDLGEFLKYNERRLAPLVNKLYGVSAQDILKGKLENNAELLDWGNAQAIEELIKDIGPIEERKNESFYRKLSPLLEEFRRVHTGVKTSLIFVGDEYSYKIFNEISYPSFLKEQKALEKKIRQIEHERIAWSNILTESPYIFTRLENIIIKLGSPTKLNSMWITKVLPEIKSLKEDCVKLDILLSDLLKEKEELETEWYSIISKKKRLTKEIEFTKHEIKHMDKVKNWNEEVQKIAKKTRVIEKKIDVFKELLEKEIDQKLTASVNKSLPLKENLQKTIELVQKRFEGISQEEIRIVRKHIELHKSFQQDVFPIILPEASHLLNKEDLNKVRADLNASASIYLEENYELSLNHLESVISYKFTELKKMGIDLSFIEPSAFGLKSYKPLEVKYKITEERNRENVEKRAFKNSLVLSAVIAVFFIILGLMFSNEKIGVEAGISDSDVSTESYSVQNDASDTEEWFVEEENIELASAEPGTVEFALEEEEVSKVTENEEVDEDEVVADEQEENELFDFSDTEIEQFFQEYRVAYMNDLNGESIDRIADYIDTNSDLYEALSEFVNENNYTDNYYDFDENQVLSVQRGKAGEYVLLAHETFYLYAEDGSEFYNSRTKEYTLITDDEYKLKIAGYETIEISNEIIKAAEPDDDEILETVHQVSEEQINSMVRHYYRALQNGFNGGGFGMVDYYLSYDGAEYEPTKEYIEKAIDKNMKMINHELIVENIEVYDSNHYVATVYLEDEYHYQSGAGDIKEVRAKYLIKVNEYGDMLIEEMLSLDILNKYEL